MHALITRKSLPAGSPGCSKLRLDIIQLAHLRRAALLFSLTIEQPSEIALRTGVTARSTALPAGKPGQGQT